MVSIFEAHSDILVKGKRKVVFGHKILLSGGESNLILDCMIERGNWSDAEYFEKGIDRLKERYDVHPEEITTDGGPVRITMIMPLVKRLREFYLSRNVHLR